MTPRSAAVVSALVTLGAACCHGSRIADEQFAEEGSGYELWGMRRRHVAVVNPATGEDPKWTRSLGGEWDFCSHPNRAERYASWGAMFAHQEDWGQTRKIRVPGYVETQGVGEPGVSQPWDCTWDCSPKPLTHVFCGSGWYRRTFVVPADWKGRRIWIKIGDVTSQGWLWINGEQVAWLESYCGTYKYEITDLVKPGTEMKVVLQVSNAVAKRGGTRNSMNRWLGVPREIELEATPQTLIDDAWVRGDFDARCAHVEVKVEREVDRKGEGGQLSDKILSRATVEGETAEVPVGVSTSTCSLRLPLRTFRAWSPEHPNLYTAKVEIVENGAIVQTRFERFGVRKLEVRGKDFYLNGKPFFVRGIGYHNIQPVYGPSRIADRDYRRFEVKRLREAGFNFLRTHTRCETPEFFEACDELGMMVQPELPYYTDIPCEKFEFNPVRDVKELFVHMRRHPSFAVYSHGNEGSFGPALGNHLYRLIKAMDPDRLVIEQDGTSYASWSPEISRKFNPPERADFVGGPVTEWTRGSIRPDRPMVAHEYLNLSVKANAELEEKYDGIWQTPFTRKMRADFLAKFGLTDFWGRRLQVAQHALQAYWLKHGLESARQDPECDGYYYWSAQDCTTPTERDGVKTYTAQGLFDPFWGDKPGGSTAASVAVYNSPRGVFCDTMPSSRIATSGETVTNVVSFANYGDEPIEDARLVWRLVAKKGGAMLAQGECGAGTLGLGGIRPVGEIAFVVPSLDAAVAASFEVSLGGVRNAWDMWLFPKRGVKEVSGVGIAPSLVASLGPRYSGLVATNRLEDAKVIVAEEGAPEIVAALRRGQNVISIGKADGEPDVKLGWWWLGEQVGTAIADDAAFRYLPHAGVLDPLFFRIFKQGAPLPEKDLGEKDLLMVCEGGYGCRYNLAVRRHGAAREYLVRGLDVCTDLPEAKALLDGLVEAARMAGVADPHGGAPDLVVGVISDVHVPVAGIERMAKTFALFDQRKVDAVLVCGDLTNYGLVRELEKFRDAWQLHFPGNRRSDGTPIVPLFIYGDHDTGGYMHTFGDGVPPRWLYGMDRATLERELIVNVGAGKVWRQVFGEDWDTVQVKDVKGYRFILSHYYGTIHQQPPPNLTTRFAEATDGLDGSRPFFFVQHRVYPGTVDAFPWELEWWCADGDDSKKLLSKHPNAVAICGHAHSNLQNEGNFWRGAFTAVEAPSLHQLGLPRASGIRKAFDETSAQCLVMSVWPHRVTFERLDARQGRNLADDWSVEFGK